MRSTVVYGPPGCGKTTRLLDAVGDARARGYAATDIAYLSFTRAAANEALRRLGVTSSSKVCTLHALCFRLLGLSPMQTVDWAKLRRFGEAVGVPIRASTATSDDLRGMEIGDQMLAIESLARNMAIPEHDAYFHHSNRPETFETYRYFVESYRSWKNANGYWDFTDMLQGYLATPAPIRHGAKVVFVDEAQDLSNLQWSVLRRMYEQEGVAEVMVAGDDDQAIYEWAGAHTHGMAEFEQEHASEREVLTQSWRVPAAVHELAVDTVARVQQRVHKEYKPRAGNPGVVRRAGWFSAEMVRHGVDTLILCRTGVTKSQVERVLLDARVPFKNNGGMPSAYDSPLARTVRTFRMLQDSAAPVLTDDDKSVLMRYANDRTREELHRGDLTPMLKRGVERSLKLPMALLEFYRDADLNVRPTIRLSTIHSAKGQEAEHVVLFTTITERVDAGMLKNPDAEARTWYVGVTRSKQTLDLINEQGALSYDL